MEYTWHDLLGNVGVACILGAYLLLQLGRLTNEHLLYSLINGVGAALILVSLTFNYNLSAFIIESAWLAISIFGVVLYGLRVKKQSLDESLDP
jgi:hypothetical protein